MHVNEVYKPTYNPGGPHCNHDSGFGRVSSLQISMFFFMMVIRRDVKHDCVSFWLESVFGMPVEKNITF